MAEVIGLAASAVAVTRVMKESIDLAIQFKDSLDRVKENRQAHLEIQRRVVEPIVQLQKLSRAIAAQGDDLREFRLSVAKLKIELEEALRSCRKINAPKGLSFEAWLKGSMIEKAILNVEKQISQCLQQFLVMSSIRIEQRAHESAHKLDDVTRILRGMTRVPNKLPLELDLSASRPSLDHLASSSSQTRVDCTPVFYSPVANQLLDDLNKLSIKFKHTKIDPNLGALYRNTLADISHLTDILNNRFPHREVASKLDQLSVKLNKLGDHRNACDASKNAIHLLKQMDSHENIDLLGYAYYNYSVNLKQDNQKSEALLMAHKAVSAFTERAKDPDHAQKANLAMAFQNLAVCLHNNDKDPEALSISQKCVDIYLTLDREIGGYQGKYALSSINHANRLRDAGELKAALKAAEKSKQIYSKLYNSFSAENAREYASSLLLLSYCYHDLKQPQDALKHIQASIPIWRQLRGTDVEKYRVKLGKALLLSHSVYMTLRVFSEAMRASQEASSIFRKLASKREEFRSDLALSLLQTAQSHIHQGYTREAEKLLREAIRIFSALEPYTHDASHACALEEIAACCAKLEDHGTALEYAKMAVELRRSVLLRERSSGNELNVAASLSRVASYQMRIPSTSELHDEKLIKTFFEMKKLYASVVERDGETKDLVFNLASTLHNLSQIQSGQKRNRDALVSAQEAIRYYERLRRFHSAPPGNDDAFIGSLINLSFILTDLGRHQEALKSAYRAVKYSEACTGINRRSLLAKTWHRVSYCYLNLGKVREAREAEEHVKNYR